MKRIKLTIAIAWLLLTTQGCFLFPKPEPLPFISLPQVFKDYTVFQEGSYWIFQNDSFPAARDSSYIVEAYCVNRLLYKDEWENESCLADLIYLNQSWWQTMEVIDYDRENNSYIYVHHEMHKSSQSGNCDHLFLDSASVDTMRSGSEFTYITGRYDTLELNGKTYSDVVRVTHEMNLCGNPNRELYYARNVGIIKRVLWDGNSWSLVRSHIVQ